MRALLTAALLLAATGARADCSSPPDVYNGATARNFASWCKGCGGQPRGWYGDGNGACTGLPSPGGAPPAAGAAAAPLAPIVNQVGQSVGASIGSALGASLVRPLPPMPERKPLKSVANDSLTDDMAHDREIHQGVSAAQDVLGEFGTPSPAPPEARPVIPKSPSRRRKRGATDGAVPGDGTTLGPKYENPPTAQTTTDATDNADGGTAISGNGGNPISGPGVHQGAPDTAPKPNKVGGSGSGGVASTGGSSANPGRGGGATPPPASGAGASAPARDPKVASFFGLDDAPAEERRPDCAQVDEKGMLRGQMLKAHAADMVERKGAVDKAADKAWCAENLPDLALEDADFDWKGFPKNMIVLLEHEKRWDDRCGGPAAAFSREKAQLRRYILTACGGGEVAPAKPVEPEGK